MYDLHSGQVSVSLLDMANTRSFIIWIPFLLSGDEMCKCLIGHSEFNPPPKIRSEPDQIGYKSTNNIIVRVFLDSESELTNMHYQKSLFAIKYCSLTKKGPLTKERPPPTLAQFLV